MEACCAPCYDLGDKMCLTESSKKYKEWMRINMTATTVKRVGTGRTLKVFDRGDCARQRRRRGHTGQQFPQAGSDEKTRSLLEY